MAHKKRIANEKRDIDKNLFSAPSLECQICFGKIIVIST